MEKQKKSEEDWKKILTPKQYKVLRQKGTEAPFSGKYTNHKEKGIYKCAACKTKLFSSDTKFDSHCGWPSFNDALDNKKVKLQKDNSYGMQRMEVLCSICNSHLGHLFDDGPKPTGKRFCINSICLIFEKL